MPGQASSNMASSHPASPKSALYACDEHVIVDRTAMADVRHFFSNLTHAECLQFCLGIEDTTDIRFSDVPPLAHLTTVICFDTEGWNADSLKLTEIGFNRFSAELARNIEAGPWGENILRKASFYHARIAENSHLESRRSTHGDPTHNRFGQTRFLTSNEARTALEEFFAVRTADGRGICPIVILGHALGGDTDKLWRLLKFDPNRLDNVVKYVDTQQIVRDLGAWTGHNQVGLQRIIFNLGFEYRDAHTASNDAAMTLIAAVLLVLPENGYSDEKNLQEVVDGIERLSQDDKWDHGSVKYCQRCHSREHSAETSGPFGGRCKVLVHCNHCEVAGRHTGAKSHMTEDCVSFALDNGNSKKAKLNKMAKRGMERTHVEPKHRQQGWVEVGDKGVTTGPNALSLVYEREPTDSTSEARATTPSSSRRRSKEGWNAYHRQLRTVGEAIAGSRRRIRPKPGELFLPLSKHIDVPMYKASQVNESAFMNRAESIGSAEAGTVAPSHCAGRDSELSDDLRDFKKHHNRVPPGRLSKRFVTTNTFEALLDMDQGDENEDNTLSFDVVATKHMTCDDKYEIK